jgi:hypothetical protein
MALDRNGNVFVTGYSTGTNGFWDYATVAYSSTGVPLWTNRYNGPGSSDNIAHAVAVDGRGNVIVTGHSASSAGDYDYATIAYSRAGVALWTNRYSGPGNLGDIAWAVAVDRTGGVFVTGQSITTNVFDGHNYVTIKYSGTGVPLWTNRYLGPASGDAAEAVAVDGNGDVIVTGTSLVTNFVYDYATIKYSGAGVPLWTNRYHGPGISDDYASAVAVDGNGNVFVTGQSYNHYATIAYSSAGTALWTNRYDGGNGGGFAWAMVVDGSGNVFVTGYSAGSNGYTDYATIKYSAVPPSLSIARTATNTVAVSWPSPSTDFTLQQNTSAAATVNWSNVVATPSDDGTTKTLVVDPLTGNRFYRLFHP